MKKLLLLSASLLGVMAFSPSAIANCYCEQGMLSQGLCYIPQGQNNSMRPIGYAICSASPRQSTQVVNVYNYLNMLWTNGDNVYFYKTHRKTPYANDFDFARADQDALNACNAHTDLRPCRHATSVLGNDSCIAYMDTPDVLYSQAGDTCQEARQAVYGRCMARYQNQQICTRIYTKQPFEVD